MVRHVIAPVDELPPGTRKFLTIDERPIAIFNVKGEFFGLLNRCPHQGASLCEGPLIGLARSSDPGEIEYTRLGEQCIVRGARSGIEHRLPTLREPFAAGLDSVHCFGRVATEECHQLADLVCEAVQLAWNLVQRGGTCR